MPVVCLDWETVHLHGEAWISHHRLRHRVFIERQGWQVPTYGGIEYDQFDTPAAKYILWLDNQGHARGVTRLIPTTRPYMVQTLWPQLVDGELPQTDSIWEASRFACDRDLDSITRRQVVAELICSCQEFGVANGIRKYLSVMPLVIFKHVIMAAGCTVTLLGSTKRMEHHDVGAGYIDISPKTLAAVRSRVCRRSLEPAPPLIAGGLMLA
jgi:N-acyl-L-homoserine lactone synthetase